MMAMCVWAHEPSPSNYVNHHHDPAKPHFAAWVWLYDINCYWTEHMLMMRPTQPEALPLNYASLCSFVGLTEHVIANVVIGLCHSDSLLHVSTMAPHIMLRSSWQQHD